MPTYRMLDDILEEVEKRCNFTDMRKRKPVRIFSYGNRRFSLYHQESGYDEPSIDIEVIRGDSLENRGTYVYIPEKDYPNTEQQFYIKDNFKGSPNYIDPKNCDETIPFIESALRLSDSFII